MVTFPDCLSVNSFKQVWVQVSIICLKFYYYKTITSWKITPVASILTVLIQEVTFTMNLNDTQQFLVDILLLFSNNNAS